MKRTTVLISEVVTRRPTVDDLWQLQMLSREDMRKYLCKDGCRERVGYTADGQAFIFRYTYHSYCLKRALAWVVDVTLGLTGLTENNPAVYGKGNCHYRTGTFLRQHLHELKGKDRLCFYVTDWDYVVHSYVGDTREVPIYDCSDALNNMRYGRALRAGHLIVKSYPLRYIKALRRQRQQQWRAAEASRL